MKRVKKGLIVASIVTLGLVNAMTLTAEESSKPEDSDPKHLLNGTWVLDSAETPGSPSGIGTRLKMFAGTHWCIIQPDPATGELVFQHGGHYTFDGSTLSETIDFAGESTSSLIGRTFKHKLKVTKDKMEQIDTENAFNETWKRAKPQKGK